MDYYGTPMKNIGTGCGRSLVSKVGNLKHADICKDSGAFRKAPTLEDSSLNLQAQLITHWVVKFFFD
jgi:hypothetical protein